jgi:outer membrane protein TolC
MGDLYPKLTLSAGGGYQAQSLATLTSWASRFLNAGPTVELPIFEGGRLRATVRLQDAEAKAAALAYQSTVLSALHEVDDALSAYGPFRKIGAKSDAKKALSFQYVAPVYGRKLLINNDIQLF